jgi:CheY-like chemotaxis protein
LYVFEQFGRNVPDPGAVVRVSAARTHPTAQFQARLEATMSLQSRSNAYPVSVLVVEDEAIIRASLAEHLKLSGFDVSEAQNGDDALGHLLADLAIDVVFSDVQMPGQLDGLDLARWIRANRPVIHVLLASGRIDFARVASGLCDPRSLFAKPYEQEAVAERIHILTH